MGETHIATKIVSVCLDKIRRIRSPKYVPYLDRGEDIERTGRSVWWLNSFVTPPASKSSRTPRDEGNTEEVSSFFFLK